MEALEAVTQRAIAGMTGISGDIAELAPICAGISDAVQEQRTTIDSLRQQMDSAQNAVSGVVREVGSIADIAAEARQNSLEANDMSRHSANEASQLGRRVVTVLRSMPVANRRKHERFPIDLALRIRHGVATLSGHSFDLSEGGMLLRPIDGYNPAVGAVIEAEASRIGAVRLKVVNVSTLGVHCSFANPGAELLDPCAAKSRRSGRCTSRLCCARRAGGGHHRCGRARTRHRQAQHAIAVRCELSPDCRNRPRAVRDAISRLLRFHPATDLERALQADDQLVFALAIDRNGYIPVHNRKFSQPQRQGDRAWNLANCRNRRIFDDRAGLLAARVIGSSLIQTYNRDMGNGVSVQMKEVDAPIRIRDQHWGGVRMAYRL